MILIIFELFLVAFFINLLYELLHSVLYKTCLEMPVKKYVPLMLKASSVDAMWITGFYLVMYLILTTKTSLTIITNLVCFLLRAFLLHTSGKYIPLKVNAGSMQEPCLEFWGWA